MILAAPFSYIGSAQRILRVRRHARTDSGRAILTLLAVCVIFYAWLLVTVWYSWWGFYLIPYRLLRRGQRRRAYERRRPVLVRVILEEE